MKLTRRNFIKTSSVAWMALFTSTPLLASKSELIKFKAVPVSTRDIVSVPQGYETKVLVSWGDPIFSDAVGFDEKKIITQKYAQNAVRCFGDDTDGMHLFPINGSSDKIGILAVNNEYVNPEIMFTHEGKTLSKDDVLYMQNSLGISIFGVARDKSGFYSVNKSSKFNRRLTANTQFELTGLVAGADSMKTDADLSGKLALGTLNNCGSGPTPWGTYLSCEENFDDFFGWSDEKFKPDKSLKRYGFQQKSVYGWEKFDSRFDVSKNPNEVNRFGWIVEIDPYDPTSTPKKRTALGRFKHENCEIVFAKDGRVVAYSGDDEVNEFVYKFVSKNVFNKNDMSKNRDILEEGTLYVAKFEGKHGKFSGKLQWIELAHGKNGLDEKAGFKDQADILIHVRLAGTHVGATPMDRCEWIAADPNSNYLYATFTNNKSREEGKEDGANPRAKNVYGQILKWVPENGDHASDIFVWSTFLLAGNPTIKADLYKGSSNINIDNMFNSPDGLKFDKFGRLWIQTDGSYSNKGDYAGMGNNQMLCADPNTGEIRRFMTGPVACEITGLTFSDDCKTMFVGIQHPGESLASSHYPNGGNSVPRSTIVMVTKTDGGVIGT